MQKYEGGQGEGKAGQNRTARLREVARRDLSRRTRRGQSRTKPDRSAARGGASRSIKADKARAKPDKPGPLGCERRLVAAGRVCISGAVSKDHEKDSRDRARRALSDVEPIFRIILFAILRDLVRDARPPATHHPSQPSDPCFARLCPGLVRLSTLGALPGPLPRPGPETRRSARSACRRDWQRGL